jgi:hypothetical protein
MKSAEVRIYALLLVAALGFSYQTWTSDAAPRADETVVVFDPGKGGASSVDWTGERSAAHLEFSGPVDEAEVWVTAGRRKRIAAPAPPPKAAEVEEEEADGSSEKEDTDPEPPEPVYGEPELTSFPGNSTAQRLALRFAPLTAMRRFDNLSSEQLAEMGLLEVSSMLVVEGGGRSLNLEIGDKAYGSSDLYAREPGSTTAYLLSRKVVGSLKSASTSLRDKNLFGFKATEAAVALIQQSGAKSPTLARQQGRHDKDNAFWSSSESEELDPPLDTLLKRVFEAKARRYLKTDEAPVAEELESLVEITFEDGATDLGTIAFARRLNVDKSEEGSDVYFWYARSTRSRDQWVEVSKAIGTHLVDALAALN